VGDVGTGGDFGSDSVGPGDGTGGDFGSDSGSGDFGSDSVGPCGGDFSVGPGGVAFGSDSVGPGAGGTGLASGGLAFLARMIPTRPTIKPITPITMPIYANVVVVLIVSLRVSISSFVVSLRISSSLFVSTNCPFVVFRALFVSSNCFIKSVICGSYWSSILTSMEGVEISVRVSV